jgi:molybdopterin-guanine dinucleotide biosynthesis protein A
MDASGFILAGGKSSRMGTDKSLLRFGDSTLIEGAIERMRQVTPEVAIVSPRDDLVRYAPVIHDIYPDRGPLGGIHAALAFSGHELNVMLAVDMPFVDPELLKRLLAVAGESHTAVTAPQTRDGWQPLCAVYRREFAAVAERSLRGDDYKIDRLFKEVATRIVSEAELYAWGYTPQAFMNLNSPVDVRNAVPAISKRDTG